MRKLIFSAMAIMLIASSVAFAQKTRSLSIYFDATAGNVNQTDGVVTTTTDGTSTTISGTTAQRLFQGNEFEFGAIYRQNFEAAQWLTFQMKVLAVATQDGVYDDVKTTTTGPAGKTTTTTTHGKFKGMNNFGIGVSTGAGSSGSIFPAGFMTAQNIRAQVGLMLNSAALGFDGLYVGLYFDTRTLGAFELMYTIGLGNAGAVTVGTVVEFWANPYGAFSQTINAGLANEETKWAYNVLDVFVLQVGYAVPFADIWSFSSTLAFRFQGATDVDPTGVITSDSYQKIKMWEDNFANRLLIRWENQINVNAGGLGLWARVRYNLHNAFAGKTEVKTYATDFNGVGTGEFIDMGIMNEVILQAGISYSFDLSGL